MAGEVSAGTIYAKLLLDKAPFTAGLTAATTESKDAGSAIGAALDTVNQAGRRAAGGVKAAEGAINAEAEAAAAAAKQHAELVSKLDAAHQAAGRLSGALLAMGIAGAVGLASITKQAMDAIESENLFAVSLGNNANAAKAWSQELRKSLGLNEYELRKQVGMWYTMLGSIGVAKDRTLGMSESLVKLAYDMASFYNLKPTEVFEKLRAGVMGEIEPLRQLGIVIDENTMKTYLSTHGIDKKIEALSQGEKAEIRYKLLLDQTSKAQGDLARTFDSPVNKLRRLGEEAKQTAIEFGTALLPAANSLLTGLLNVTHAISGLSDTQKNLLAQGAMWATFGLLATGAMASIVIKAAETAAAIKSLKTVYKELLALDAAGKLGVGGKLALGRLAVPAGVAGGGIAATAIAGMAAFTAVGADVVAGERLKRIKAETGLPPRDAALWETYKSNNMNAKGYGAWRELERHGYSMRSGVPVRVGDDPDPMRSVRAFGPPAATAAKGGGATEKPGKVSQDLQDQIDAARADQTKTLTDDLAVAKRHAEHLHVKMEVLRAKGGKEFGEAELAYAKSLAAISKLNEQIAVQGQKLEKSAAKTAKEHAREHAEAIRKFVAGRLVALKAIETEFEQAKANAAETGNFDAVRALGKRLGTRRAAARAAIQGMETLPKGVEANSVEGQARALALPAMRAAVQQIDSTVAKEALARAGRIGRMDKSAAEQELRNLGDYEGIQRLREAEETKYAEALKKEKGKKAPDRGEVARLREGLASATEHRQQAQQELFSHEAEARDAQLSGDLEDFTKNLIPSDALLAWMAAEEKKLAEQLLDANLSEPAKKRLSTESEKIARGRETIDAEVKRRGDASLEHERRMADLGIGALAAQGKGTIGAQLDAEVAEAKRLDAAIVAAKAGVIARAEGAARESGQVILSPLDQAEFIKNDAEVNRLLAERGETENRILGLKRQQAEATKEEHRQQEKLLSLQAQATRNPLSRLDAGENVARLSLRNRDNELSALVKAGADKTAIGAKRIEMEEARAALRNIRDEYTATRTEGYQTTAEAMVEQYKHGTVGANQAVENLKMLLVFDPGETVTADVWKKVGEVLADEFTRGVEARQARWNATFGKAGEVLFSATRDSHAITKWAQATSLSIGQQSFESLWKSLTMPGERPEVRDARQGYEKSVREHTANSPEAKSAYTAYMKAQSQYGQQRSPLDAMLNLANPWLKNAGQGAGKMLGLDHLSKDQGAAIAGALPGLLGTGYGIATAENKGQAALTGAMGLAGAGQKIGTAFGSLGGPIGMAAGALLGGVFGSLFGGDEEAKRARDLAQKTRDAQLDELRRINNALAPVTDYFRGMNLNLLPASMTFGGGASLATSYAVISDRGARW